MKQYLRLERLKKENNRSESNLHKPTIARYVGYKLMSCKTLKWKPCSWAFSLGFSTSEADNRIFPAVKRKPHDINNNTVRKRELHLTHFWQQRASPGGKVCLNNHVQRTRRMTSGRVAACRSTTPPPSSSSSSSATRVQLLKIIYRGFAHAWYAWKLRQNKCRAL